MTNSNAPFSNLSGKVLRRSRDQRMLSGVSGGIAEYFNIDVTLVRLGIVVLTLLTGGTAILGYVAAWVIIPEADAPGGQQTQQPPTTESDIASRIYDDPKPPTA
ncbi:MAG TPA: PspC domain-containing protein [Kribbella sp.]|nr:PspC domain-containing protein [Kribbella sp.]